MQKIQPSPKHYLSTPHAYKHITIGAKKCYSTKNIKISKFPKSHDRPLKPIVNIIKTQRYYIVHQLYFRTYCMQAMIVVLLVMVKSFEIVKGLIGKIGWAEVIDWIQQDPNKKLAFRKLRLICVPYTPILIHT